MTKAKTLAATALAMTALAGCEARQTGGAVAGLCPDWKASTVATDPAAPVDNCVKRFAFALAGGRDDAATVADAVVAACETTVTRWNQTNLAAASEAPDAFSIVTGQPTNPQAEHYSFAQSRALLYVAQARAGRCAAPEVKDGVPVGVAL